MIEEVRHPRLFSVFRATLYLCAAAVALLLALVGVTALGALLVGGGIAVVTTGDVNLLALGGYAGLVVAVVGLALAALTLGVRYVERRVHRADRVPDPLETLKREYVDDGIDEHELEHRFDGLLGGGWRRDARGHRPGRSNGRRDEHEPHDDETTWLTD